MKASFFIYFGRVVSSRFISSLLSVGIQIRQMMVSLRATILLINQSVKLFVDSFIFSCTSGLLPSYFGHKQRNECLVLSTELLR